MEETILLSKHNEPHFREKVITLKKVQTTSGEPLNNSIWSDLDEKVSLEIEVANLKQQIRSLQEQSEHLLFDLKQKIDQEKEAWQLEKENERKQAQAKGYEEGYREGQQSAMSKYESLLHEANEIVEKATEDYYRTIEKHQQAIITLAIKASEKIITKEITLDETYVTSIISKAMDDLKDHSNISIYVSPKDYGLVMKQKDELEQSIQSGELLSIYVDTKLHEGDCIISDPFGQIDVSIDLQLQQIKNALEEKLMENQ